MDKESSPQVSTSTKTPPNNSLYIVFKYVAIGTGILGIGFLIAILGFLLTQR